MKINCAAALKWRNVNRADGNVKLSRSSAFQFRVEFYLSSELFFSRRTIKKLVGAFFNEIEATLILIR